MGRPVRGRLVVRYGDRQTVTHGAWTWTGNPAAFETWCGRVNPGAKAHARALFVASPTVPVSCGSCRIVEATTGE